jgi:polysaccharide deacetylase 2 family uncharacterized protein YibQ
VRGPFREFLKPDHRRSPLLITLLLLFLLAPAGCRKEPSTREIRSITREMVRAVQQITQRRARVTMQPEAQPGEGRPRREAAKSSAPPAMDHIYISRVAETQRKVIEQELGQIAAKFGLQRAAVSQQPGAVRIEYRLGRRVTHTVHIRTLHATPAAAGSAPRLAIIIDDLGYDRSTAARILSLGHTLTVAVLPGLPNSAALAAEAHRGGLEVLLHLPMESENGTAPPETSELRAGMPAAEAARMVAQMLDSVPYAVGVNNHQGSRATRDARLMETVMAELRERKLFFIDSRTTAASVAYRTAERSGVPSASRSVFLDDSPEREEILRQIRRAEQKAREQGSAIAIGHPHPATLEALRDTLPQLEARGIRLVFASELVR